jgi:retron-type reverse transcriptase
LKNIFNLSLNTGIFPDDWKIARVTPIYKSESKTDCGNYRPMNENKVIAENQSGFRPNHSIETTLLHSIINYLDNMDKGLINGVVFIDLKKAFDTVDHALLLAKLERCGVRETTLKWFKSYLHQRKQVCKINNAVSDTVEIHCGVPPGSNLGPLLFNLYINDLPNCLQTTKASMFADDINLSCKGQSSADIECKLNCDLDNIQKWLISNKITLNLTKTEYMLIGSQQRLDKILETPNILCGEHQIKRVREKNCSWTHN